MAKEAYEMSNPNNLPMRNVNTLESMKKNAQKSAHTMIELPWGQLAVILDVGKVGKGQG